MDGAAPAPDVHGAPDSGSGLDATADVDRLFTAVYAELRQLAHRRLGAERAGHTLSTTALVHEAYLKLTHQRAAIETRAHFFALAAQAMRRILVDYARRHRAIKRDAGDQRVSLSVLEAYDGATPAAELDATARADTLIHLDEVLERLRLVNERLARVVELRFFTGLTEPQTAELLGVTIRTVARDWARARAWLYGELRDAASDAPRDGSDTP